MANCNPPVKGQAFVFYITLTSVTTGRILSNPTIAAGDFTISKDGGNFASLNTTPTVTPASSKSVKVTISTTEADCDGWLCVWADQTAPPEWSDGSYCILTTSA